MKIGQHQNHLLLSLYDLSHSRNEVARVHGVVGKTEGHRGDLNRRGLKGIRLNDVDSRLKLIFRHGRMFDVLFLNKHQTFQICFKRLVYYFFCKKMCPHRTFQKYFKRSSWDANRMFGQGLKFIIYFLYF
jgi:hypothetical protein